MIYNYIYNSNDDVINILNWINEQERKPAFEWQMTKFDLNTYNKKQQKKMEREQKIWRSEKGGWDFLISISNAYIWAKPFECDHLFRNHQKQNMII